jgi:precorrin-2/cobalt-factor-2 C20-methyltransferase
LIGVGVGPGDPELVTVKAARVLHEAGLVVVPSRSGDGEGRAEATVRAHAGHDRIERLVFALSDRNGVTPAREQAWEVAARTVLAAFDRGVATVAFATIGDPAVYSTFGYLAQTVRACRVDVTVSTVPGVTAMQALASAAGVPLVEGRETLTLVPATAGPDVLDAALGRGGSVVVYKGGRRTTEIAALLRRHGRLDGAVVGTELGLPGERIVPASDARAEEPYLCAVLVPPARAGRGRAL